MTQPNKSRWWIAVVGLAGIGLGAAAMYLAMRRTPATTGMPAAATPTPAMATGPAVIEVAPDAVARAGIQIGTASEASSSNDLQVPGHVEANGYTQVAVRATAQGRITAFTAELGSKVRKGQVIGQLFAPDVADQQRVYLSMRAELEAAHAKLLRTENLVKLGSVSQQELEAVRASHTAHATDVEGVRARLILLGVSNDRIDRLTSPADISGATDIVAPSSGVVIRRSANAGLNVQMGEELGTIADLSEVWVVADVFERDLPRVRVGSGVVITSPASPGATWRSTIAFLDPQVVPETRTARLRADVKNPGEQLKMGQYVDVSITGVTSTVIQVPREAVQTIADRHFVYVPDAAQAGRFVEREVKVGQTSNAATEITSGLTAGDRIVTAGSFFLRSERDRLGLPLPPPMAAASATARRIDVAITEKGFEPARVTINQDQSTEVRFTRRTDQTCAKAIVIPSLGLERELPLNVAVSVSIPPQPAGELEFTCGMKMLKGALVVK